MKRELDCRGLQCPQPVMRCREALNDSSIDNLLVVVDNAPALENVTRFLSRNGFTSAAEQTGPEEWRIFATKGEEAPDNMPEAPEAETRTLVFISSETLGRGDEALGAKLMDNFLGSLGELGNALWRVILVNGGVKLASRPGAALDSLKKLSDAGVGIFVCGTCLMHYGLLEQKAVGETTNMMDILSSMALAQKIIRP